MADKETEQRLHLIEMREAVDYAVEKERDKWIGWMRTVCITSTTGIMTFLWWLGGVVVDKSVAFKAAILAFWSNTGHGQ